MTRQRPATTLWDSGRSTTMTAFTASGHANTAPRGSLSKAEYAGRHTPQLTCGEFRGSAPGLQRTRRGRGVNGSAKKEAGNRPGQVAGQVFPLRSPTTILTGQGMSAAPQHNSGTRRANSTGTRAA